jgi:outer membrane PBP1 activator LpoA protein
VEGDGPTGIGSKAAEAKEALTIATNEASALRMQAMGVEAAAKLVRR